MISSIKIYLTLIVIVLSGNWLIYAQEFPGLQQIPKAHIRADLNFLAAEELQGRDAGRLGGQIAGKFLVNQLIKYNLVSLGEVSPGEAFEQYMQPFTIIGAANDNIQSSLVVNRNGNRLKPVFNQDYFYFFNTPQKIKFSGKGLFAGYAINAEMYKYDDFKGLKVRDRLVVAYYGEPLEKDSSVFFNGTHRTHFSSPRWKARYLSQRGAKALILIPNPDNLEKYRSTIQRMLKNKDSKRFVLETEPALPVIYLSWDFTQKLFGEWVKNNYTTEKKRLKNWLKQDDDKIFSWYRSDWKSVEWQIQLDLADPEKRNCSNILAVLPGKDKNLKNEYVVIGAHYDHEGIKSGDVLPGADDNASGVAATLNTAKAFAKLQGQEKPKRSILFAFWDAEEKGMLGSQYFVDQSTISLNRLKTVINMDMIGRDASFNFAALRRPVKDEGAENKVMLFYSAQLPQFKRIAKNVNRGIELNFLFDPNVFFTSGSDHINFHEEKIPVLYYFTGFHMDYNSPKDTPEKINLHKLTRITKHVAATAYHIANLDSIPNFNTQILSSPEGDFSM